MGKRKFFTLGNPVFFWLTAIFGGVAFFSVVYFTMAARY
jgi:hypothetical protein